MSPQVLSISFSGGPALLAEISSQESPLDEDRQEPSDLLSEVIHEFSSIGNVANLASSPAISTDMQGAGIEDVTPRSALKHVTRPNTDMEMNKVPGNQEISSFSNHEFDPEFPWSEFGPTDQTSHNIHQPGSSAGEGEANVSETNRPASYSSPSFIDNSSDLGDTRNFYFNDDGEVLEEEMRPNELLPDLTIFDDSYGNSDLSLVLPATGIIESEALASETDQSYLSDNEDPYDEGLVGDTHPYDSQLHGSSMYFPGLPLSLFNPSRSQLQQYHEGYTC